MQPDHDDLELLDAVRDLMLPTNILPATTLSADAHIGDTSYTVTDPTLFTPGQLLTIYDRSGEEELAIASDAWEQGTNPIPLRFNGMGYSGLQFAHHSGAEVGTNLFTEIPNQIDEMLSFGDPVVYIVALAQQDGNAGSGHLIEPVYAMRIEYRRSLLAPKRDDGSAGDINPNIWAFRQQRAARKDVTTIEWAIVSNPSLTTDTGDHCIDIVDSANLGMPRFTKLWTKIIVDEKLQHFAASGQFSVRGFHEVFATD